jgi:Cupin-like domain
MVGRTKSTLGIPELLICGRGGRFNLHYDSLHCLGFVTQLYGDKEFIVFAPEDSKYHYPNEDNPKFAQIDNPFAPDLERFPLFAYATPCRFVLRPGETIFDPAGWWHATRMLSLDCYGHQHCQCEQLGSVQRRPGSATSRHSASGDLRLEGVPLRARSGPLGQGTVVLQRRLTNTEHHLNGSGYDGQEVRM